MGVTYLREIFLLGFFAVPARRHCIHEILRALDGRSQSGDMRDGMRLLRIDRNGVFTDGHADVAR